VGVGLVSGASARRPPRPGPGARPDGPSAPAELRIPRQERGALLRRVIPPADRYQGRQGLVNRFRPGEEISDIASLAGVVLAEEQDAVDEPGEAGLGPVIEKAPAPQYVPFGL
jgi:hypothetical protein